jgi:HSP20 family protein
MDRLHDELEQLFDELWRGPRFARPGRGFRPHVDVFNSDEPARVTVVVDLAGVDPDDVHVVVHERLLVIAGERRRQTPECAVSYHRLEIQYGSFARRVSLPEAVDPAGAEAHYERGLLTIEFPIAPAPQPQERTSIKVQIRR